MHGRTVRSCVTLVLGFCFSLSCAAANAGRPDPTGGTPMASAAPIPFLDNSGQAPEWVRYYARTPAGSVVVTASGAIEYRSPRRPGPAGANACAVFTEQLAGAAATDCSGDDRCAAAISRFKGRAPSGWMRGIPAFASVRFGEVYPGIRFELFARAGGVEKRFYVGPGADPDAIRLQVGGAESLTAEANGELTVATPSGPARFTKPVAYQEADGRRDPVAVAYRVNGCGYGFAVGPYDRGRELVIDPLFASTFLGGQDEDAALAMAVDGAGNVYVAGETLSDNFPATPGAYSGDHFNEFDVFVAKFDPTLRTLLACTFLGANDDDRAYGMDIGRDGNVYLTGETCSRDFPVTAGALDTSHGEWWREDAFVAKFDGQLTNLIACTYLGGRRGERGTALKVGSNGRVYVAGYTWSAGFPVSPNACDRTFNGYGYWSNYWMSARALFVRGSLNFAIHMSDMGRYGINFGTYWVSVNKEMPNGQWVDMGGAGAPGFTPGQWHNVRISAVGGRVAVNVDGDDVYSVLDTNGPICAAGGVGFGTWVPPDNAWTSESYLDDIQVGNDHGVFFSDDLSAPDFEQRWNLGSDPVNPLRRVVDGTGNYMLQGWGWSWGAPRQAEEIEPDGFVCALDSGLTRVLASTFLGGAGNDQPRGLALAPNGDVLVCGESQSADFPTTAGAWDRTANGDWAEYVASFRLKVVEGGIQFSLRRSDSGRYYVDIMSEELWINREGPWGVYYNLAHAPVVLATDQWHVVSVASTRTNLVVSIDGTRVASVADEAPVIRGDIALAIVANEGQPWVSDVVVDDISVTNRHRVLWRADFQSGRLDGWGLDRPAAPWSGWHVVWEGSNAVLRGEAPNWTWANPPWRYEDGPDGFVARFDEGLTRLVGATFLGGAEEDRVRAVAVGSGSEAYVGGYTWSRNFPTTPGAYGTGFQGGHVGFVAAFAPDLSGLRASTLLGDGGEMIHALCLDGQDRVYVGGSTWGGLPVTADPFDGSPNGGRDGFVAQFTANLTNLLASTFLGGWDDEEVSALVVWTNGRVYAAGQTYSPDFPTTNSAAPLHGGGLDAFVLTLDAGLSGPPLPHIRVSPPSHNFGYVRIGNAVTQTFHVVNAGKLPLLLGAVTLEDGADAGQFRLVDDRCSGRTLAPYALETGTLAVAFAPASQFGKAAVLRFRSNDPDSPTNAVPVYGSGRDDRASELRFQEALARLAEYNAQPHPTNALLAGHARLMDALAADPRHYGACIYGAASRLLTLVYDTDVAAMLTAFGMPATGRDLWNWTARFPELLPTNCPTSGQAIGLALRKLLPAVDDALVYLGRIPTNWTGSIVFSPRELPIDNEVQVDAGDVRMFQAGLEVARAFLLVVRAHNLDFDFSHEDHLDTPVATLTVDGNPADWIAVKPLYADPRGDNRGGPEADISRVYTAMDRTDAYFMVETYGKPIHPSAPITLILNFKPGRGFFYDLPFDHDMVYDDLCVRFSSNAVSSAWDTNTVALAGVSVARGQVFEARIPLAQLGNPGYVTATYVNIWPFGLSPAPPGDPSNIQPSPGDLLAAYPAFGTVTNAADFAAASNALLRAIGHYLAGSDSIRAELDYQADDLVVFDPEGLADERRTRLLLAQIRDSLLGRANGAFKAEISQLMNLGRFFSNPLALRDGFSGQGWQRILGEHGLFQFDWALNHLANAAAGFSQTLTPNDDPVDREIEIDDADIAFARCELSAWKAFSTIVRSYNLDIDGAEMGAGKLFRLEDWMNDHPAFLTVTDPARLASARDSVIAAIDSYETASRLARAETDPQTNDLFTIAPLDLPDEAELRAKLADLKASMSGPVTVNTFWFPRFHEGEQLHLGRFFVPSFVTRAHFPRFTPDNAPIAGTFPDPTFNGILVGFTLDRLAELTRAASISGVVRASGSATPLNDITVVAEAMDGSDSRSAQTDAAGRYALAVSPGVYRVFAEGGRLGREYWHETSRQSAALPVAAGIVTNADFTLDAAGLLSGRVRRARDSAPIAQCVVEVEDEATGERVGSAWTDAEGRYSLNLPTGGYRVQVRPGESGLSFVSRWYSNVLDRTAATVVRVAAPAETAGIDFALEPAGRITGRVSDDATGSAIARCPVAAHDARTGRWAGITATDRDGRYTLWVPAGADYRVVAAPLNAGLLFADEWFRDAAQATQALAIAVTETNITGGVDFELTPRTALGIDVTPNSGAWSMTVRPAAYAGPTSGIGDLALALAPTGVYSVTFGPMAGWQTPQPRTAALSPDTHVVVRAAYNGVPRLSGLPGFWVLLGDTVRFDVMATDPDGSTPSLSTTAAPSAAVFTDHGDGRGRFYWVPSGTNSLGDHEVVIAATDGQAGDTAAAAIHVSSFDVVRPTNGAAILQGGIVDVSWTGQWPLNRVDVDLLQGTNFVARVATNVVAATTAATYSGVVPPGVSTGADYRIEVTDRDNPVDYDRSPAFSVVSSGPWASAVPRGGPWFYSDWFGYFADLGNGWMWHQMHGFLFALGTDDSSLWFWGPNLGWFWTSRGAYPFLYSFHRASWMYYWRNTVNPQGFWNLSTGQNEWVW